MDALTTIEANLHQLLIQYDAMQQQVAALKEENLAQRQEILRTHGELSELQTRFNRLQTAASMLGDEAQRARAKQQITYLIEMVDQTLQTLRQG